MNQELLTTLVPILKKRILQYHEMFSLPLIAEQWEETLSRSFEEMGLPTTWTPDRSHKVGEDMSIKNIPNSRISCKSGQFITPRILNKKCVKFNGSRTTTQKTIEDKIAHLCNNHDDYYFLLAKSKPFNKKYKLLVFPSSICKVNQLEWTLSKSGKQYKGIGLFNAEINTSMSSQLWTALPLDMIIHQFDIDCN
tara:strand:- start:2847 stop:3428 length:582 start_codon:yes stop_codon:yes gene_type:complete